MRIDIALQGLLGATQDAARAKATSDVLRVHLVEEAKKRTAADGAAPTWKSPLGQVRWDGTDATPARSVTDPAEFASFLAERAPAIVTATLTVAADQLEQALSALAFSQIDVSGSAVTYDEAAADQWLNEHSTISAADSPTGFEVYEFDPTGTAPVNCGSRIPGVGASKSAPKLVVVLNPALKAEAVAAGVEQAESLVEDDEALETLPAATAPLATVPPPRTAPPPASFREGLTKAELMAQCRSAGLPTSGTKAVLEDRLDVALRG